MELDPEDKKNLKSTTNVSSTFLLLGLGEMEDQKHLYFTLFLIMYGFIMVLSTMIVFVLLTEPSLHKPMYMLICNLVLNGIFGSCTFFPKLLIDLLTSTKTVSREGCLVQSACLVLFAHFEIATLTFMAYDRFLAICNPLRYSILMTNKTAVKLMIGGLVFCVTLVTIGNLLLTRLYFCGTQIKNIYCEKTSLLILSCVDTTLNKVHGETMWGIFLSLTIPVIMFSYLKIFIVCMKLSKESRKKAVHTVMTHLVSFLVFMMATFFLFIRYRVNSQNLPLVIHNLISVVGLITPPLLNPLIYGIRTKALKIKLIHYIKKLYLFSSVPHKI